MLGEENCAWLVSFKPLQRASAFRLYCKSIDMKIKEYDEVAKDLDRYVDDKKWKDIIKESEHFVGVVESISPSPCSMLLYDKPVDEEIGLIRTKDGICCNLDGYNCDKYKFLKNDYLTVSVWSLIRKTCELANIKIPTIDELNRLLDDKTFEIYEKGLTCTVNQADSKFATDLIMKYKPKNVAEMSAFVAAIRPGFASLLDNFIERKPYTTGVEELDELLEDSYHYLMYQESIMKYLIWLGIAESESYDIIKKIAKKKFKEQELKELKTKLHDNWKVVVGREDGFNETWQVVEDASRYSFNASHSLSYAYDSLYGAYLKSHYPLEYYTVAFNNYSGDAERTTKLTEELKYFDIKIKNPKFRYSKSEYFMDKNSNSIYKGIGSIKYISKDTGDILYNLKDNKYEHFIDLLVDVSKQVNSRQMEILIKLDFFEEFGRSKKLLKTYEHFNNLYSKKQISKEKYPNLNEIFTKYALKETEKQFKFGEDFIKVLYEIEDNEPNEYIDFVERVKSSYEYIGSCDLKNRDMRGEFIVLDIDTKYTPRLTLYSCGTGGINDDIRVTKKIWKNNKVEQFSVIKMIDYEYKYKRKKVDDEWVQTDEKYINLTEYYEINN